MHLTTTILVSLAVAGVQSSTNGAGAATAAPGAPIIPNGPQGQYNGNIGQRNRNGPDAAKYRGDDSKSSKGSYVPQITPSTPKYGDSNGKKYKNDDKKDMKKDDKKDIKNIKKDDKKGPKKNGPSVPASSSVLQAAPSKNSGAGYAKQPSSPAQPSSSQSQAAPAVSPATTKNSTINNIYNGASKSAGSVGYVAAAVGVLVLFV